MYFRSSTIISTFLIITCTVSQITQCQTYVSKLINDILDYKITSIPLPTLLYSGITPNNPGQIKQCKSSNYSYFLVSIKNTTLMVESYYGLCVPKQCSADDIQFALQILRVKVYDADGLSNLDLVVKIGGGVVLGWIFIVIVFSLWIYFKQPVINQYLVGQRNQMTNSEVTSADQPSSSSYSQNRQQDQYIFNYYQGYKKLFVSPPKPNPFSLILFLAVISYSVSVQFSYRQNIAQNISEVPTYLNSPLGIFICNTEIALHTIIFILGYRLAQSMDKLKKIVKIGRLFFDVIMKKWINLILMSLLVYSLSSVCISQPLVKVWNLKNAMDCKNYIWQIWFLFRNLQLDSKLCLPWFSLIQADLIFTLLSAPLIIIFRTSKKLGYFLLLVLICVSLFISYAILKNQDIIFEPTKLMNTQKQYWVDYQGNAFVRLSSYSLGLLFGLFATEPIDNKGQQSFSSKIIKFLRKSGKVQLIMGIIGFAVMIICYGSIYPHLDIKNQDKKPYIYMIFTPLCFVLSLGFFTLPSTLQLKSFYVALFDKILTKNRWIHLDRLSLNFYILSPMIIAYTTYSSQNSINYNIWTVLIYLFGDLFITYFISILATVLIQNQLIPIVVWLRDKIIGKEVQYRDILIQYM